MFYPDTARELQRTLEGCFLDWTFGPGKLPPSVQSRKIYGIICPHAGYAYSGAVAANAYYRISSSDFQNAILIGPNHYGIGAPVATMTDGTWETPLGQVSVNSDCAKRIVNKSENIDSDEFAHSRDHCLEVQIPFLQFIKRSFSIVPIVLIRQDIDTAHDLGQALAETISEDEKGSMIIASSDLTHYEPNPDAHRKDDELLKAIISLDVAKFYSVLEQLEVSACGFGAIASTMIAAKRLGATRVELLKYATSGDVTGDQSAVVGYSSLVFL